MTSHPLAGLIFAGALLTLAACSRKAPPAPAPLASASPVAAVAPDASAREAASREAVAHETAAREASAHDTAAKYLTCRPGFTLSCKSRPEQISCLCEDSPGHMDLTKAGFVLTDDKGTFVSMTRMYAFTEEGPGPSPVDPELKPMFDKLAADGGKRVGAGYKMETITVEKTPTGETYRLDYRRETTKFHHIYYDTAGAFVREQRGELRE